jgi:membrane protein implicated in regulation of membrane protease activity
MKPFTMLTVFILSLIAVLQLTRFVQGWEVSVDGVTIPVWVSGVAFVVVGGLAAMLWRESRTPRRG